MTLLTSPTFETIYLKQTLQKILNQQDCSGKKYIVKLSPKYDQL